MARPVGSKNKPKDDVVVVHSDETAVDYANRRLSELGQPPSEPPKKRRPSVTITKRLAHPLGMPSVVIPMKDPAMVVRVVDSQLRAGRVAEMRAKGWELVAPGDVKGTPEDFGFGLQDGRVVRGERGRDVLMKMHKEDFDAIQMAKARENTKGMGGKKAKAAVVEEVSRRAPEGQGDEAADFVNRTLTVQDQRAPEPALEEPQS